MGFGGSGSGGSIGGSTDSALSNPQNNDVLTYSSTLAKWQNKPAAVATDATTSTNGVVRLAGDLGGTAAAPTVPALANLAVDATVVHLAGTETITGAKTFSAVPIVPDSSFATSKVTGLDTALTGKQAANTNLTAISGLTPTDNDVLQRKSGAWTNRTPAQLKTDLSLTATDVGLGNVNNTSDANKPISTATQTALNLKADATTVGTKTLLIANAAALPAGTPAGVIVVVQS